MELEIIKHRNIFFRDILRAIAVKSIVWPYSLESQMKWIVTHISDEDKHVFLKEGTKDLAYMNLVNTTFIVNKNTEYLAYGIGNVCSAVKGKGYGEELMRQIGSYIKAEHRCGLLFCKTALVPFYERYDWEVVEREACKAPVLEDDIHIMTYLTPETISDFNYKGKLF